jgi:hypothetical protein
VRRRAAAEVAREVKHALRATDGRVRVGDGVAFVLADDAAQNGRRVFKQLAEEWTRLLRNDVVEVT